MFFPPNQCGLLGVSSATHKKCDVEIFSRLVMGGGVRAAGSGGWCFAPRRSAARFWRCSDPWGRRADLSSNLISPGDVSLGGGPHQRAQHFGIIVRPRPSGLNDGLIKAQPAVEGAPGTNLAVLAENAASTMEPSGKSHHERDIPAVGK